jgi:uncharacterized protein (DUF2236 family)
VARDHPHRGRAGVSAGRPVMRRVHRERALLAGGGRALVMQLAHPAVAAGVAQHSDFPSGALGRLRRTIDLTLALVYGTQEEAARSAAKIRGVHELVRGSFEGSDYEASDPRLLLWVHATLIDSTLVTYERFVSPIPEEIKRRYYEESKEGARMLGIPDRVLPADLDAFASYLGSMLAGGELRATDEGRRLVAGVLRPPLSLPLRPAAEVTRLLTLALLPPPIRDLFGLRAGTLARATLRSAGAASRLVLPGVPRRMRTFAASRV